MPPRRSTLRTHRTKIVATLGPASATPEQIAALFHAGVDVFRLNFSHGDHADHGRRLAAIRALEGEVGRPIGVLADVQGPKLRVGRFAAGHVQLTKGQPFRLDLDERPGDARRVQLPHPEIIDVAHPGSMLLVDDGKLRLEVTAVRKTFLETTVRVGGRISDRKGVNVPDMLLPIPALTEKDQEDIAFALDAGVDYIGLSFVQRPEDVIHARTLVGDRAWILSKIEKPQALLHLEALLELSDAVMVARGDLGVELPPEDVPIAQKRIVRAARRRGRPVIVATQMLESMIHSPAPTRAEASDVAGAVFDGADAVMLSAETAAGEYPVEAVSMMNRIIQRVERDEDWAAMNAASRPPPEPSSPDAIAAAARQVANTIGAKAIVAFTNSGATALRIARQRPEQLVLGVTSYLSTARRLALVSGVHAVTTEQPKTMTETVERAVEIARRERAASLGDEIVIAAGVPIGQSGATNALRVARVERAARKPADDQG